MVWRQIGIEKAESVWRLDDAHAGGPLLVDNLIAKSLHSRPMHFRPEMVLGVVAVIKPNPVVKFIVTAHAPRHRLVRIAAVMPIVPIQVRETVTEIVERKKKTDVAPVEDAENDKGHNEKREFENAPECFARIFALQLLKDRLGIFPEKTEKGVLERMLGFAFLAVFVN